MGAAIYPRIENTDAEWARDISGKALSKNLDRLQKRIQKQGHKELMDYFVPSEKDLEEWGVREKPEQKWFNPMEGLAIIESMIREFRDHREQFEFPEHLEEDLEAFRKILDRSAGAGLRWRLALSY